MKLFISYILLSSIHGFILALLLFLRNNNKANKVLAFLLFIFSTYLIEVYLVNNGYIKEFPFLMLVTYPTIFFIGPLIYYYQKKAYGIKISTLEKVLVFGWPIIIYIMFVPYYILDSEIKINWQWYNNKNYALNYLKLFLNRAFFILNTLAFIGFAYYNILKSRRQNTNQGSNIAYRWFRIAIIVFIFFLLLSLVFHFVLSHYSASFFTLFLSINIHIIAYGTILRPNSFTNTKPVDVINHRKYKTSPLDKSKSLEIKEKFSKYLFEKKPYLQGTFSLEIAASELNIPKHHLSQVINQELNSTFSKIIKKYRVDEASLLLEEDKTKEKKMIIIALESGFTDSSTFYRAFKELKNMSPSTYRKSLFN
ncbi:helix-turn-helix domain-containing protein [uncultured Tenacibaculum sp.]|uniref:helix-turn-helix domain-containing protein n=1 Tax=uncultured Tenacibaculum sp. TaxID=174713 RepID=UPI00260D2F7C|nr:helix-turn-helix domain-containing protein [uncultured Tenacibaculum sp.]